MPRSASASRRSLKDLDPNFRKESGTDHLKWIDAFDRRIAMRGLGWLAENRRRRDFRRIPDRAAGALPEGVQILSHCPAGVYLSFGTDSPDLSVKVQLDGDEWLDNMPATGAGGVELYQRDGLTWCSVAVGSPSMKEQSYIRSLLKNASREPGEYRLYLPLYRRVCSVAIGIARNARLTLPAAPVHPRPVVFYGTSITQGGCANTAGSDFVSLLGRRLDREMVNLGFSGNGKGDPFAFDLNESEATRELYLKAEAETGYVRDRNVFREGIDIEDSLSVMIRYRTGEIANYSLNVFCPDEGFRTSICGDKGRIDYTEKHASHLLTGEREVQTDGEEYTMSLRVQRHFEKPNEIDIAKLPGGHGGGDALLQRQMFSVTPPADSFHRSAGHEQGAASLLIGVAAIQSLQTGERVILDELTPLGPRKRHLHELD